MVYRENFVAVIRNGNSILREHDGIVALPFGSEYSIYMKNKNTVKALVSVDIDGVDVLDGKSLIIRPKEFFNLKGFMKGTTVTNKFRFIEKTKHISDYRGDRVDDGIVSVTFKFEKEQPTTSYNILYHIDYSGYKYSSTYPSTYNFNSGDVIGTAYNCTNNINTADISKPLKSKRCNFRDDGITVKGSQTCQDFAYGNIGELESVSHVINIKLMGYTEHNKRIQQPITTKSRFTCSSCGRKSKSSSKFCSRCGTFLE